MEPVFKTLLECIDNLKTEAEKAPEMVHMTTPEIYEFVHLVVSGFFEEYLEVKDKVNREWSWKK